MDAEVEDVEAPRFPEVYERFDRLSDLVNERFDEVNRDLLAHCPVARSAERGPHGYWLVSRFDDVRRLGQSRALSGAHGLHPGKTDRWAPEEVEDPLHTPLRRLIDGFMSPKVVEAQRPAVERIAHRLIDGFVGAGRVDAIEDYGRRLAGETFCTVLTGMPPEDMPDVMRWFHERVHGATPEARDAGTEGLLAYHRRFLELRRAGAPRGDIIDALLGFEFEGFDDEARVGCLTQLSEGGLLTTSNVVGEGLRYLATHPDAQERLRADPSLIERAVEEWLRTASSVYSIARYVEEETEIAGVTMQPGDWAYLNFASSNFDPRKFPDPSTTDLERWPNPHVAFGFGRHRCPGSHIARQSLQVAFEAFLARTRHFELEPGFTPAYETNGLRVMLELPLRFTPAPGGAVRP